MESGDVIVRCRMALIHSGNREGAASLRAPAWLPTTLAAIVTSQPIALTFP